MKLNNITNVRVIRMRFGDDELEIPSLALRVYIIKLLTHYAIYSLVDTILNHSE